MNSATTTWIDKLGLKPHPEGGYFKENYRATDSVYCEGFVGKRLASTAIYYLLEGRQFSAFHRMRSDELWHHYTGSPLIMHMISNGATASPQRIGSKSRVKTPL